MNVKNIYTYQAVYELFYFNFRKSFKDQPYSRCFKFIFNFIKLNCIMLLEVPHFTAPQVVFDQTPNYFLKTVFT